MDRSARLPIPLLALLVSLTCTAPARAQDPGRVQDELARTDMRIERVEMLFARNPIPEARPVIDHARLVQDRARSAFRASQYGIALRLTFEARDYADRAVSMLQGLPDPDRVRAQLERTRDIIERAREHIAQCEVERPRFLLQVASAMEQRAEDAARDERYLAALQLTMSARERALRALRLCNLEENARDTAERSLRRTDESISRAHEVVDRRGDERARESLARAEAFQSEARREFVAGRYDPCLRLTQSARSFAHRAIRLTGGSV